MRARHWFMLIVLSILWGGTFVFAKEALTELPPLTVTMARCFIATTVLVPLVLLSGHALPATPGAWRDFAVMAVLNNVIPFGLIFWAQTMIPSGLASVMNATTPLMALLVARFVAGEALAGHKVAGLGLGLAGVALLVGPAALAGDRASAFGMLLVVGGALSYGFSGLWGRRFKATPAVVSSASQLLCSTLILLPGAGVTDRFWLLPWPGAHVIVALLGLGILSTALAYILFFRIMAEAGSNNVMLVTLLIPVSGIAIAALWFGEHPSVNQLSGTAVITASLVLIDGRLFGLGAPPTRAAPS